MNEYKLLDKTLNEDIDKVREFAEARNELHVLKARVSYLNGLLYDSNEMYDSVWTTLEGVCKPVADLDDDHIKNIAIYLTKKGEYNKRIAQEAVKRFDSILLIEPEDDFN